MRFTAAYVGIGSNLDGPRERVEAACADLAALDGVRLCRRSSLYLSRPHGIAEQPDFINAVAALLTSLDASALHASLQALERSAGRRRKSEQRWGPRTLDLDLLLFGQASIERPGLTVPHPRIAERNFVLLPLAELSPALSIPGRGTVQALLDKVGRRGIRRLDRNDIDRER